tara:strand:- start:1354 stop:2148 length:795 start_codon:yes stop_codon:yes gene_type:complete
MLREGRLGMGSNHIKTYMFMALITLVSSVLLSYSYSSLKSLSEDNIRFDIQRNIVKSVGIDISEMSKESILNNYKENINEIILDENFKKVNNVAWDELVTYEDKKNGVSYFVNKVDRIKFSRIENKDRDKTINKYLPLFYHSIKEVYVFPISGKGLWSTLFGFLALDKDKNTVKGITFYKHKETPGLGGEVDKKWFQDSFIGKRIFNSENDLVSVEVLKGVVSMLPKSKQIHAVDGITGATITSKGLSNFLLRDLKRYEEFLRR